MAWCLGARAALPRRAEPNLNGWVQAAFAPAPIQPLPPRHRRNEPAKSIFGDATKDTAADFKAKLTRTRHLPHHEHIKIEGRIGDVFFHRFVVELTSGERLLADLGPKGAEVFPLETGAEIVAEGEMKPSELKVERIARKGEKLVEVEHKKKHPPHHHGPHDHHHDAHAEPDVAKRAVARAGYETIGEPRRKPKHFEVLGRKGRRLFECHVAFDGDIYKEKPVEPGDHKWSDEMSAGA